MLTAQELKEIELEITHLPDRKSAKLEALRIIQRHRGYISNDAIEDISACLGTSVAEIDRVATFYNTIYREPVGKHVILVCDSISCFITGGEPLANYLQKMLGIRMGGTTADGGITLLPSVCLGHCDLAPVMMLDGTIVGNLTVEKIDEILGQLGKAADLQEHESIPQPEVS